MIYGRQIDISQSRTFFIYIWQNTIWRVLDSQSQSFKLIPRHKIKTFAFTTGTINKSNFHKIVQN